MKKAFLSVAIALMMAFSLSGCGGNAASEPEYLEDAQIQQAFDSPNQFKGKYVNIQGKVFNKVGTSNGRTTYQAYYDPKNYSDIFAFDADSSVTINIDDYVLVDGKIVGELSGANAFGGLVDNLSIEAVDVEVVSYIDAVTPTIKEVVPQDAAIDQNGFTLQIDKVEFAEDETRVYMTETNNSGTKFSLMTYSMIVVQNGQQIEEDYTSASSYEGNYPELSTDLVAGATSSGIVVFPALSTTTEFQLIAEGYSSDYNLTFEPFTFTIDPTA